MMDIIIQAKRFDRNIDLLTKMLNNINSKDFWSISNEFDLNRELDEVEDEQ